MSIAEQWRREDILSLLFDTDLDALCERANRVLDEHKGRHVFVRGLVEFSNHCRRNCRYCGLRSANTALGRYSLTQEEILAVAANAVGAGVDTIVLQSGEYDIDARWLADVVSAIVAKFGVAVTLSVGEQPRDAYALWREAGATRFLLKHETADKDLYATLHPGHSLEERIASIRTLQELGYETGSGFIVGVPGQRRETLADDILLAHRLGVAMCGAGPFVPQAETPLGNEARGPIELNLRVMAVLRIVLPWANLPATTALATLAPIEGQTQGLRMGGNVLMPSFTPGERRAQYRIYDNKHRVDMDEVRTVILRAGRTHSLDRTKA